MLYLLFMIVAKLFPAESTHRDLVPPGKKEQPRQVQHDMVHETLSVLSIEERVGTFLAKSEAVVVLPRVIETVCVPVKSLLMNGSCAFCPSISKEAI